MQREFLEPEPDLLILKATHDGYARAHPRAQDVLLLIEIADSSLAFDLGPKCSLYARYGVCEYWVVDLIHEPVVTHHQPAQGAYQVTHRYGAGDALSARFFSDIHIAVGRLFGK